jgi:putative phosphoesterase
MKVCILSDSHDNRRLLEAAVEHAQALGAEAVLHCGDVVAPSTLSVLKRFALPVHVIHGNNTGDLYMLSRISHRPGSDVHYYGQDAGMDLGGRRIFLVHYPHYARAMATTGDWDLVCCGHDHDAKIEQIAHIKGGHTMLVNPGTVGAVGAPATYVLGNLATMEFELVDVPHSGAAYQASA